MMYRIRIQFLSSTFQELCSYMNMLVLKSVTHSNNNIFYSPHIAQENSFLQKILQKCRIYVLTFVIYFYVNVFFVNFLLFKNFFFAIVQTFFLCLVYLFSVCIYVFLSIYFTVCIFVCSSLSHFPITLFLWTVCPCCLQKWLKP